MEIIHYIQNNWFQIIIDATAALNVIAAGARVMGWSKISDECGRLENAIAAMVQAALNKNKGDINVKKDDSISINASNITNPK